MSEALTCMRSQLARQEDVRIGIADLVDGTGASLGEGDNAGRMVTQRPDLMLLVAMSRAGARLVNRTSIGVVEWEMREAMARRLGEGRESRVGDTSFPFRPVRVGEIVGSTFYVSGAVTEYNYNIHSDVQEAGLFGVTAGRRSYRVSVAVDLVVTRSTTTEVRLARSYGKQLVGQEIGVGVFRFLDVSLGNTRTEAFEANIGQRQNEPVQTALRWVIETGAYDILSELFGRSETCDQLVPGFDARSNAREAGDPRRPAAPAAVPAASPETAPPAVPAPSDILQFEQQAPDQPAAQQPAAGAPQQARATPPAANEQPPATPRVVVAEQAPRPSLVGALARLLTPAPANDTVATASAPPASPPATPPPSPVEAGPTVQAVAAPTVEADVQRGAMPRPAAFAGGGSVMRAVYVPGGESTETQRHGSAVKIHLREIDGRSVVGFELPPRVTYEVARRGDRWVLLRFAGHSQILLPEDRDPRFLIRLDGNRVLIGSRVPLAVREADRDGFVVIEQTTARPRPVAMEPRRARTRFAAIGG
ncbi:CsgG/HfaB family protein [Falsiroseomonas stagni]|uniref:Curli production assembly/transport component CsgG n=1 Tax=Falsiroseomonas stagni DSM 19981 TaxID=1123062 RepID=A0A1I4EY70_9PROT|nr:CsgG/HfaB family protein [Falsiroseomonas stagni]SFL09527.1 Curli production assembly/transport component CsgG [Falsiroseomonas stagni DSM 19981]